MDIFSQAVHHCFEQHQQIHKSIIQKGERTILEECLSEARSEQAAVGQMGCQHEGIPALASLFCLSGLCMWEEGEVLSPQNEVLIK